MRLRNKETGEIKDICEVLEMKEDGVLYKYYSLAELNKEWEDYKVKKYWWISPLDCGVVEDDLLWNETEHDDEIDKFNVEIGNYFETEEEAKTAVEKLKAWKRLKDKGFRFNQYETRWPGDIISFSINKRDKQADRDLDLLFGGEE